MRFSSKAGGFIFFANPKTGSTSVEKLLTRYSKFWLGVYKHTSVAEARELFHQRQRGGFFESAFKFTFTRNPWDRMVSLYEYSRKHHGLTLPFDAWTEHLRPDAVDGKLTSACSFEAFTDGGQVDEIIKLEEMNERLPPLLSRLNIPCRGIPKANAIPRAHYRTYYNQTTEARIASLYTADIERFGYSF